MSTWRPAPTRAEELEPRRVVDSLGRVLDAVGGPPAAHTAALFSRWEQLVGAEVAAHAQPHSLRGKVLVVVVDEPAWAAQLKYLSGELLARLDSEVGPGVVSELRLRVESAGGVADRRRPTPLVNYRRRISGR